MQRSFEQPATANDLRKSCIEALESGTKRLPNLTNYGMSVITNLRAAEELRALQREDYRCNFDVAARDCEKVFSLVWKARKASAHALLKLEASTLTEALQRHAQLIRKKAFERSKGSKTTRLQYHTPRQNEELESATCETPAKDTVKKRKDTVKPGKPRCARVQAKSLFHVTTQHYEAMRSFGEAVRVAANDVGEKLQLIRIPEAQEELNILKSHETMEMELPAFSTPNATQQVKCYAICTCPQVTVLACHVNSLNNFGVTSSDMLINIPFFDETDTLPPEHNFLAAFKLCDLKKEVQSMCLLQKGEYLAVLTRPDLLILSMSDRVELSRKSVPEHIDSILEGHSGIVLSSKLTRTVIFLNTYNSNVDCFGECALTESVLPMPPISISYHEKYCYYVLLCQNRSVYILDKTLIILRNIPVILTQNEYPLRCVALKRGIFAYLSTINLLVFKWDAQSSRLIRLLPLSNCFSEKICNLFSQFFVMSIVCDELPHGGARLNVLAFAESEIHRDSMRLISADFECSLVPTLGKTLSHDSGKRTASEFYEIAVETQQNADFCLHASEELLVANIFPLLFNDTEIFKLPYSYQNSTDETVENHTLVPRSLPNLVRSKALISGQSLKKLNCICLMDKNLSAMLFGSDTVIFARKDEVYQSIQLPQNDVIKNAANHAQQLTVVQTQLLGNTVNNQQQIQVLQTQLVGNAGNVEEQSQSLFRAALCWTTDKVLVIACCPTQTVFEIAQTDNGQFRRRRPTRTDFEIHNLAYSNQLNQFVAISGKNEIILLRRNLKTDKVHKISDLQFPYVSSHAVNQDKLRFCVLRGDATCLLYSDGSKSVYLISDLRKNDVTVTVIASDLHLTNWTYHNETNSLFGLQFSDLPVINFQVVKIGIEMPKWDKVALTELYQQNCKEHKGNKLTRFSFIKQKPAQRLCQRAISNSMYPVLITFANKQVEFLEWEKRKSERTITGTCRISNHSFVQTCGKNTIVIVNEDTGKYFLKLPIVDCSSLRSSSAYCTSNHVHVAYYSTKYVYVCSYPNKDNNYWCDLAKVYKLPLRIRYFSHERTKQRFLVTFRDDTAHLFDENWKHQQVIYRHQQHDKRQTETHSATTDCMRLGHCLIVDDLCLLSNRRDNSVVAFDVDGNRLKRVLENVKPYCWCIGDKTEVDGETKFELAFVNINSSHCFISQICYKRDSS